MVDPFFRPVAAAGVGQATSFDAGLRAHMQRVFNYMAGGVALTGIVAYVVAHTALAGIIFGSPLKWVAALAPFGFIFFFSGLNSGRYTVGQARTIFWSFCAVWGLSLATIFFVYSNASIARAFFISAADFAAMSLYGYTTRRNLTSMGAFMMMGVFGLMIAFVVNFFLASPMLYWIISVVGVVAFTGLTAFDAQYIKQIYADGLGADTNDKMAISGALRLYMDFLNLFMFFLRLTGSGRD